MTISIVVELIFCPALQGVELILLTGVELIFVSQLKLVDLLHKTRDAMTTYSA
jgi:hypothetical protein